MKQRKINVTHLLGRKNYASVRFQAFPLLEFSSPLERCSDIYAGPTSCLIVTLLFNVLFLWYFPLFYLPSLSINSRSANICPVHSKWALSSLCHYKTRPLRIIGYKCVLGLSLMLLSKAFFQISLSPPLNIYTLLCIFICIYIYTVYIYIQLWSELLAPLVNMIKEGCAN